MTDIRAGRRSNGFIDKVKRRGGRGAPRCGEFGKIAARGASTGSMVCPTDPLPHAVNASCSICEFHPAAAATGHHSESLSQVSERRFAPREFLERYCSSHHISALHKTCSAPLPSTTYDERIRIPR